MASKGTPERSGPTAVDILKVCVPAFSAIIAAIAADPGGNKGVGLDVVFWLALGVVAVSMVWAPFEYLAGPHLNSIVQAIRSRRAERAAAARAREWVSHVCSAMPLWLAASRHGDVDDLDAAYQHERDWLIRHEADRPRSLGTLFRSRLRERFPNGLSWFESKCDNGENPFRPLYRSDHLLRLAALMSISRDGAYSSYAGARPEMTLNVIWDSLIERMSVDPDCSLPRFSDFEEPAKTPVEVST